MKEKLIFFLMFAVLLSINAAALSTDLKKEYAQRETIIIKIQGKVLEPINSGQVKFIREGHVQEIPIEYEVKKLGEDYYIWAIAPDNQENITLMVNGIHALEKGLPKEINYRQNFSIGNSSKQYSVRPGAIISDRDFKIKIISYLDENIEITTDFPESRRIIIEPGENSINYSVSKVSGAKLFSIKAGDYSVPAFLIGDFTKVQEGNPIAFEPGAVKEEYGAEDNIKINFSIVNRGEDKIKDIELKYSEELFNLDGNIKSTLDKGEREYYNLTLKKKDSVSIREIIYAKSEKFESALPISVDFEKENKKDNETGENLTDKKELYRCSELGGKICKGEEICKGSKNESLEGICCLGSCVVEDKEKDDSKMIGYIIAGIVIIGIIILYIRYKRTKTETNLMPRKFREAEKKVP